MVSEKQLNKPVVKLENMTPYEINPELARLKAKELYLVGNYSKQIIMESLGIPESTLNEWINVSCNGSIGWKFEKEMFHSKTLDKLKNNKGAILEEVLGLSIDIIHKGLLHLKDRSEFSLAELRKVSDIIGEVNKGLLLEQGKPTEIRASFKGTQDELDKLLNELQEVDEFQNYKKKDIVQ